MLYAAWAEAGLFPVDELKKLRKIDHPLEGHPTPVKKYFNKCHRLYLTLSECTTLI